MKVEKERERQRRKEKDRERQAAAAGGGELDEEEEIRKAIEASKRTAASEEKKRVKQVTKESTKNDQGGDFDFGKNFDKFATGQALGGDNPDDFDFGGDVI